MGQVWNRRRRIRRADGPTRAGLWALSAAPEPAAADLRGIDGDPPLALAGSEGVHRSLAQRGGKWIDPGCHLLRGALEDDAPANPGVGFPAVDLEGDPAHDDLLELRPGGGAKHDDRAVGRVVDRQDLRLISD